MAVRRPASAFLALCAGLCSLAARSHAFRLPCGAAGWAPQQPAACRQRQWQGEARPRTLVLHPPLQLADDLLAGEIVQEGLGIDGHSLHTASGRVPSVGQARGQRCCRQGRSMAGAGAVGSAIKASPPPW